MRWSLILSTFLVVHSALTSLCIALAVPPTPHGLERRGRLRSANVSPKTSPKTYRNSAQNHDYLYTFSPTGSVTRKKLMPDERFRNGKMMLKTPNVDADHVFEVQMLKGHLLANHNLYFNELDPDLREKVKGIINGPGNMAPVPAGVNRAKGQLIKHGMQGKDILPKKTRDGYTLLSYGTARKTAKRLDKVFNDHGYDFKGKNSFHYTLRNTMNHAKILTPGQPSPPGSSRSLSPAPIAGPAKAGPRRSARAQVVGQGKPKVMTPTRKSARIAAKTLKNLKAGQQSSKGPSKSTSTGVSNPSSPKAGPRRSARIAVAGQGKPKVDTPTRKSARIATKDAKNLKPSRHSPAGSSKSLSSDVSNPGPAKTGPRRSARIQVAGLGKPKVTIPTRKSARIAAKNAKNLTPGQHSPAGSSKSLSSDVSNPGPAKTGPRRSARIQVVGRGKPKVTIPTRKSARIAAKNAKNLKPGQHSPAGSSKALSTGVSNPGPANAGSRHSTSTHAANPSKQAKVVIPARKSSPAGKGKK